MDVDLTGLLGGHKKDGSPPAAYRGGAPVGGLGDIVPQKLKLFSETTHNICIKIQQTTVVAVIHFTWGSGHSFLCSL